MKTKILCMFAIATIMMACGGGKSSSKLKMDDATRQEYERITSVIQELQAKVNDPNVFTDTQSITDIQQLSEQLHFSFNPEGMDSLTLATCQDIQRSTYELKTVIDEQLTICRQTYNVVMLNQQDKLLEKTETYPIYLERGDKFFFSAEGEKALDVKIYNADSRKLLKSYSGKSKVNDSLPISFKAVYLMEINPRGTQYTNATMSYRASNLDRLTHPHNVTTEVVEATKSDFRATSVKGIKMQSLFEEPRKFTLRGQLKAAFSGSYRAIVAVQVPAGATDILYSLRISTNEGDRTSDGKFPDNMELSYKKVKLMGLPVYESHRGGSIISTILGENCPPREEDAYINLYVFYNADQAKKFQDGKDPATLSYNLDYSKMGTQSCDDRIPTKGYRTVYLGFLNERVRYNNYVWLEAVSAVPNTEYFKEKYTVE